MTTRHLPASLLTLSLLTLGIAGAADTPPASKYPLAKRPPAGGPQDAAGRQARLEQANRRFDKAYGKQAPAPAPTKIQIREPAPRVGGTTGTATKRMAGRWPAVNPPASTASTATATRPYAGVRAPSAASSAARAGSRTAASQVGRQAARAGASRGAGRLVGSVGKGAAGAAVIGGGMLVLYGVSELAESGSPAELGASVERSVSQGLNDLATGNVQIDARDASGLAKDLLIGTPAALAVYGGSEIVLQEIADPGKTLRDIQTGNINVDTGEVLGLGAAVGASVAFGGPAGLLAYGTVKIIDQEIKDPGKTSRDIKTMTGVDLEQTGKDIEKAAQDVGGFIDGLFGGSR